MALLTGLTEVVLTFIFSIYTELAALDLFIFF
jgi:hypothetical protein